MAALGSLWISYAPDRYSKSWKNACLSWEELCKRLSTAKITAETFEEYRAMTKEAQADRKDVGGFVGGPITGGRRLARSVTCRTLITLDIDYATADFWTSFTLQYNCAAFLYATHSSSPDKPRLRLIIPLSREVLPDQYEAVARRIGGDLDIEIIDPKSFEVQQLMYWPSVSSDVEYYCERQHGPALDVDTVLGRYNDWKDASQWPVSSKVQEVVKREIAKQADPTTKTGVIGAFCRTYDIHKVIEEYLSDIYIKTQHENRYTYTKGSTAAGLVVHDNGIFAYTHHQTDPIGRNLCNAFDLVRLHLYGGLDAEVDARTPGNKRPSFMAMREEALRDEMVRYTMNVEQLQEAGEVFADWTEAEKSFLKDIKKDKQGNTLQTITNCELILEFDPNLKGCFCFDEFINEYLVVSDLPWRTNTGNNDLWDDSDSSALYGYLERYGLHGRNNIDDAVKNVSKRYKRHPVREYLNGLTWDGKKRIDTLLVDYFGAEDSPYVQAVTRKTFVGAVARVFSPGIKFDWMLVLISEEGKNKSTFLEKMGAGWFSSDFGPLDNLTRAMEQIQGAWVIEVAELAAIRKSDIETVKHFIAKTFDRFRKAFGRHVLKYDRQCIFIGTTNKPDFLNDAGKNRRFWPVQLTMTEPEKDVWEDLTPQVVGQIWAEACALYNAGEQLHLDILEEMEAAAVRDHHREQDDRNDLIRRYCETPLPDNWDSLDMYERREYLESEERQQLEGRHPRQKVSVLEIWTEVFNGKEKDATIWNLKFIKDYLDRLQNWDRRVIKIAGRSYRGYVRLHDVT